MAPMNRIIFYFLKNRTYILIFISFFLFSEAAYGNSSPHENLNYWEYLYEHGNTESWQSFTAPGQPLNPNSYTTVTIRTKLPTSIWREPALYFVTNDQFFEVYLGKEIIYQFGVLDNIKPNQATGSPWHMIELPDNYAGKTLEIKMKTNLVKNTGLIRTAIIGSKSDLLLNFILENMTAFILALLFIFLGLGIFSIFFIQQIGRNAYFSLGFASICVGCWLLAEGELKQLFIYAPRGWLYIAMISFFLIPVGFCLFVKELFALKHKVVLRTLVFVQILILLTSLFLDIINLYSIVSMLIYEYILMLISFIGCTVIVTKRALEGDPDAKIFSIGFTILTLSGLYDILGWYFRIVPWFTFMFMWAMLIFVLLLTYILIRRFREINNRIKTFYVEIEHKNKDLEEQQKRLEEAISYDKMKTEFFSNISHEFRTPLNIILSSIQLLHLYIEDGTFIININQTTSRLKIMQQNCYRLIRLLNNLIDITKIDSGYFALTLQNHNIVEITENITLSVADYIKSKGISLTFDTDTEEKIMACDPDLIERILLNLLSNAVKFTQPGADIWVNLYDLEDSVMIEVKDGGIGIEKDKLDGIFERFVQVDKSLSRQREGSGIGLSLVKSLVEMHGGIVTVDSEIGVGTTFSINLPAKTVNQDSFFDYISTQEISHHVEKISVEFSDIYS